jgi:hypothetical protein
LTLFSKNIDSLTLLVYNTNMKKLTKKLSISTFLAMFFVVLAITFAITGNNANAQYDSGYGSYYDSGYGSAYDSGYGSYYDSGYGSAYDSGYGSYYDSGYGSSYDSGYGSYYDSGYGSSYDSGYGSYYDSGYGSNYDSGYGSYYDSGYGSNYDSGYGSYYDSGYGSYYDSGYGSAYDSGYGSYYDSGYGSGYNSGYGSGYGSGYYSGYDDICYDCGGSDYNYNYNYDNCYDCGYTPPCTTCDYVPPCTNCNYVPPVIPALVISCTPNTSNIDTDQSVTWSSHASGGSGSYSYSWSGTDGLSGSGSQVSKTYYSTGSKNAHVTVTSGGRTASADCGVVYVEEQNQSLSGSCSVDDSSIDRNQSVRWSADASGGNGSYSYEWSGTYPLSGKTGRRVSVSYDTTGEKYGSVTIRSGGQSITRTCGTVYVEDNNQNYNNLNLSCTVNNASLAIGQTAIWNTSVYGGNGNYYYSWSGTDGIYGNSSSISKAFNTIGSKYATVTVTSDGQTKSLTCPTVVVGGLVYPNNGTPASLSSVYLNQVPYTGIGDNPKFIAFILGLFMFSALGAYMIVSRKAKIERKNKILDFKHENMLRKGIK